MGGAQAIAALALVRKLYQRLKKLPARAIFL